MSDPDGTDKRVHHEKQQLGFLEPPPLDRRLAPLRGIDGHWLGIAGAALARGIVGLLAVAVAALLIVPATSRPDERVTRDPLGPGHEDPDGA